MYHSTSLFFLVGPFVSNLNRPPPPPPPMMLIHPHPAPAISSFPPPSTAVRSCPFHVASPGLHRAMPCHASPYHANATCHPCHAVHENLPAYCLSNRVRRASNGFEGTSLSIADHRRRVRTLYSVSHQRAR
ncbi:hypothetical protein K456DRAFT_47781 [Colletotrichum gloeosporioides 23]|nr:hypothetical protein K456DRAFT_47781 [Colletotrichum gloeosporioides 23]